jgi:23S rRNA (guanosine2251-2'-O)-methyltransferase
MIKLDAGQLRTTVPTADQISSIKKNDIYIILDNVLDTYNVGSIFRLADAVAAKEVILCGETLTPPNTRIKKASINTTEWVNWKYCKTAEEAIEDLRFMIHDLRVYAVEQSEKSKQYDKVDYQLPLAITVGNETYGVSKDVLEMADEIVEIPMFGENKSLNVMVSCGIVLFEVIKNLKQK